LESNVKIVTTESFDFEYTFSGDIGPLCPAHRATAIRRIKSVVFTTAALEGRFCPLHNRGILLSLACIPSMPTFKK